METKELALYREVSSMTGEVLYSYNIEEDIMVMYKGDSAKNGTTTTINNYVDMLRTQNFSEEYRDNMNSFMEALSTGAKGFFDYEIKTKMDGYQESCYKAVGKTVYNDNNTPTTVIGKMYPVEGVSNGAAKLDRGTGVLKAQEFINQLKDRYKEYSGRAGGFILLSLSDVYRTVGDDFEADLDKLYVNIAQCLSRLFSYNAIIGRLKKDEFGVVYFGRDVSGEFLSKVEDLKEELDNLAGEKLSSCGVRICGGVSCEPFVGDGKFGGLINAGKAMGFAKYTGKNTLWMYSEDVNEAYNTYRSEDKRMHTAQMKLEHKLIQNTFKVLAETQNVEKTIMEMFETVGAAFKLDRISMFEYNSKKASKLKICSWEVREVCNNYANRPMAINSDLIDWINSKVKMEVVSDTAKIDSADPLYGALTDRIKSCVVSGYKVGTVSGCISFETHESKHKWTSEELNIFELVIRTISTCLITVGLYFELLNAKEDEAKYDNITGLYKYNVFLEQANKYISTHRDEKLAVVRLKLDGFIRVNQFYGYDAGDEVLKNYSAVLSNDKQRFIMGCRLNADNLVGLIKLFDNRGSMLTEATADVMYGEFLRDAATKYPAAGMSVHVGMSRVDNNGMGITDYIEAAGKSYSNR